MKPKIVKRPWGEFEQFCKNELCTVKIHFVKPKQELSLQSHKKRDELWKIIEGNAVVTIGKREYNAKEGDSFLIKRGRKHKLIAKNKKIKLLEICFGTFDENDEIRYEDKYGRNSPKKK